ncbi:MAG TPA: CpsB/CapC family capsule biosynthesis tyrosine phosphatase [Gaiellaceae bacterium]|nr:CpsB/CapC family capsule biosynthesis tyrosine phosphatase [Gaiellaceae bacterium]
MIDLHSHILPGLDDGAATIDESVAMARSMAEDGIRIVAATPHVRNDYPTTPTQMEEALRLVRDAVASAGIDIDVRPGGEIALDELASLDRETLLRFGLGGHDRALLLEYPYSGWPLSLESICIRLRQDGIVPVIAHPERNREIQRSPSDLEPLVAAGGLVQLTAASVDGRLGRAPAACARRLLELELAHLVASDAHSPGIRSAGLSAAAAAIGGRVLARWLTLDVPEAILAGDDLPPRPMGPRRRSGFLGRIRG